MLPIAFLFPLLMFFTFALSLITEKTFVDRKNLHMNVTTAIKNGAQLSDVKQIFENRKHAKGVSQLFDLLLYVKNSRNSDEFYREPVNLTTILKDIKSELYLTNTVDLELVASISKTIAEHEKTNPFDKLEPSQRIHFELIQTKLGDKYAPIQENVVRIVDEIDNKNMLVSKYFSDATMSFRISIIALVIGILALIPQLKNLWSWWRDKFIVKPNKAN